MRIILLSVIVVLLLMIGFWSIRSPSVPSWYKSISVGDSRAAILPYLGDQAIKWGRPSVMTNRETYWVEGGIIYCWNSTVVEVLYDVQIGTRNGNDEKIGSVKVHHRYSIWKILDSGTF